MAPPWLKSSLMTGPDYTAFMSLTMVTMIKQSVLVRDTGNTTSMRLTNHRSRPSSSPQLIWEAGQEDD